MEVKAKTRSSLSTEAFFAVVSGEILLWETIEVALRDSGVPITVGRLIPLHCLVGGPLRLQELTERMNAKSSAASRLVERMVGDGLIAKQRDEGDGRAVLLHVTDEGRRVEAAGWKVLERSVAEMFGGLDDDELRELCALLGRMRSPLSEAGA